MIPSRIGRVACHVSGGRITVYTDGRPYAYTDGVVCTDWGQAPVVLAPTVTSVKPGKQWRRWLGAGTVIVRSYTGAKRQITETIVVHDTGINIDHQVAYTEDVDVHEHCVRLRLLRPRPTDLQITTNGIAVELRRGAGLLDVLLDSGRHTPNFVFAPDAETVHSDYNSRGADTPGSMVFSMGPTPAPVILPTRDGRQGVIMWSIHADRQTAEVTRALCFGSSAPAHPYYGVKGFISRGLPVTQSVFAVSWTEAEQGIRSDGLDNSVYKSLIDEMYAAGCEISPHGMLHGATDRQSVIEHISAYEPYNSVTWIDHSLGDGTRSAGLKSEGWNPEAPNYIMDLLEAAGFEAAWSYYDYHVSSEMRGIIMAKPYVIGSLPNELCYQNTNLQLASGAVMWQWPAWRMGIGKLLERLTTENIDTLIRQRAVTNIHEYFTPTQEGALFTRDGDTVLISDGLDAALSYMQSQVVAGHLWHPTVRQWIARMKALRQVAVRRATVGFAVTNSGESIPGFTVFVPGHGGGATLNGTVMNRKGTPDGAILWGDLGAGESILILQ